MCAKRKPELLILTETDVAAIRFALELIPYAPVDSEEQTSVNLLCRDLALAAISPGPVKLAFGPLRIVTAAHRRSRTVCDLLAKKNRDSFLVGQTENLGDLGCLANCEGVTVSNPAIEGGSVHTHAFCYSGDIKTPLHDLSTEHIRIDHTVTSCFQIVAPLATPKA
jgi:hypothetical protein